ncbi:MAG TPA: LuxR C-terminal-related transcriptional regulator [Bacteroidia bacterium]|nr:LuxR C-terminal-related transcriptional regulator [Bacteroidia bacterium]
MHKNKKGNLRLAIFDHDRMRKDFMHHVLDHGRFEVLFSTTSAEELIEYSQRHPPDVLIIHDEDSRRTTEKIIAGTRKRSGQLACIVHHCSRDEKFSARLKTKYGAELYFSDDSTKSLMDILFKLKDEADGSAAEKPTGTVAKESRFYLVVQKSNYMKILAMLVQGKSMEQISDMTELTPNTVKTYISRMHDLTGCHTNAEIIDGMHNEGIKLPKVI